MKKLCFFAFLILLLNSICQSQEKANSLLWRIEGRGIDSPSYLFGTIHLPQKKFVNFSDSVYVAIQNTSALYNELDFFHQSLFGDTTLINYLLEKKKYVDSIEKTTAWKKLIERINKRYNVNLDPDNPDQFLQFSQQFLNSLYQPEEGMLLPDMMIASHALMLGKKTGGLETMQHQFEMIYEVLDARLSDSTLDFQGEVALTEALKKFYVDERVDSIGYTIDKIHATFREPVFDRRNKTMVDSMVKHMTEQACFFAIGAGHLGGSHGVIGLLRERGYAVTPVRSTNKMSILIANNMLKMSDDSFERTRKAGKEVMEENEGVKMEDLPPPPPPPPPAIKMKAAPQKKQPVKKKT